MAPAVTVTTFKAGVKLDGLDSAGARILACIDDATVVLRTNLEVSCGTDSHPREDPHSLGNALDISLRGVPTEKIIGLVTYLRQRLGSLFTVLLETPTPFSDPQLNAIQYLNVHATGPHVHVQLVKGLHDYPPPPDWKAA